MLHRQLATDIGRMQATKVLRSIGQGALLVAFALYLAELGWSAAAIGSLLSAGALMQAVLSLPVGVASDRFGRKPFVVGYELGIIIAAVLALFSEHPAVITVASLLGAFGRGQVGMVGPAAPAEQAWIAELVRPEMRGQVYSNNAAYGFIGTGIGSLIASLVPLWADILPGAAAYRPLFLIPLVTGAVNVALLLATHEPRVGRKGSAEPKEPAAQPSAAAPPTQAEREIRRQENIRIFKLGAINAMNGLAVSLTGPLLSYWFAAKFGVGPGEIGPVFAVTHFATAFASILTGQATRKVGVVRSIVAVRLTAVLVLLVFPFVPSFWLAAALHVLRSALNRGTQGARQALTVALVRGERRGFASSINSLSMGLPNSAGPVIAGYLLSMGYFALPFYIAAAAQFLYGILFGRMFQQYDPVPASPRKRYHDEGHRVADGVQRPAGND